METDEAKQEFHGAVGDVAGRDVVNHNYSQGRLLTKTERADLNKLVRQLEIEFGTPGWQTWKFLHRTIGVENIETMCLIHRDPAETILGLLLDRAKLLQASANHDPVAKSLIEQLEEKASTLADLETRFKKQAEAMRILRSELTKAEGKANKNFDSASRLTNATEELQKKLETSQGRNRELSTSLEQTKQRLAAGRRNLAVLAVALVVAMTCGAIIWRKANTLTAALELLESKQCMYSGKPYAIGSVIDNANAPDIECIADPKGGLPSWRRIESPRRR
ncbi:hypothetical protein [Burkholderia sp. AW49-1]